MIILLYVVDLGVSDLISSGAGAHLRNERLVWYVFTVEILNLEILALPSRHNLSHYPVWTSIRARHALFLFDQRKFIIMPHLPSRLVFHIIITQSRRLLRHRRRHRLSNIGNLLTFAVVQIHVPRLESQRILRRIVPRRGLSTVICPVHWLRW